MIDTDKVPKRREEKVDEFGTEKIVDAEEIIAYKDKSMLYKMIALRNTVIFPTQTVHFDLGRDKSLIALERAYANKEPIFLVSQIDKTVANPTENDIYKVGVLARIQQVIKLPNDTSRVLVTGLNRYEIAGYKSVSPCFEVYLKDFYTIHAPENELVAIKGALRSELDTFFKLDHKIPKENIPALSVVDGDKFIASASMYLYDNNSARQELLETANEYEQLKKIYERVVSLTEILAAEKRIATSVRESMDKNQKEYYLREQVKAIHAELGDDEQEIEIFREKAKEKNLPEYAMEKFEKELNRMSKMSSTSPEAGVIRTYIECVLDLPWNEQTETPIDLVKAEEILDAEHYGLEKVKERIIEYLAVHQLSGNLKGAVLCFVGPPGVGKTSIVSSIARSAGRELVQMSLGGVRDEAEIRGHRKTYIGAMPGRIISGMKNAGVNNPVFLLDEIDKMSSDFRGDPASAMLEVLDPNQNSEFKDHYLEMPYDLSKTMFVCTANSLETIPTPLLDRMEVIRLSGYTYAEKLQIAKRYLFPKQLKANGMQDGSVSISDKVLEKIIMQYTRESGVRSLEREIASVIRKLAVKTVKSGDKNAKYKVSEKDLENYLGPPKYKESEQNKEDAIGLVTGLAWTSVGGVTLDIEVAVLPDGKGEITLTGNMGDVMKESARTAYSLVRSLSNKYDIDKELFKSYDLHIHIPEGATPKDGPSAGITLTTAILSALTKKKVRADVAMTGEITLTGKVLAIGGLKEKSLAGYRAGVKTLIIPYENEKDITDIPNEVKENVEIKTVKTINDVLAIALA